jgi:hypothetical protein
MTERRFRRKAAADHLRDEGFQITPSTLAKMAVSGDGPPIEYWGRFPTYPEDALMEWARARLSRPVRSTAEHRSQAA